MRAVCERPETNTLPWCDAYGAAAGVFQREGFSTSLRDADREGSEADASSSSCRATALARARVNASTAFGERPSGAACSSGGGERSVGGRSSAIGWVVLSMLDGCGQQSAHKRARTPKRPGGLGRVRLTGRRLTQPPALRRRRFPAFRDCRPAPSRPPVGGSRDAGDAGGDRSCAARSAPDMGRSCRPSASIDATSPPAALSEDASRFDWRSPAV